MFIIQYSLPDNKVFALFSGDLEGNEWRTVKNRCLKITESSIKSNIVFLKVPHHGSRNLVMETCLPQLINNNSDFVASISCPPGSADHPSKNLLDLLKLEFPNCQIACTNVSKYCHDSKFSSTASPLLEQSGMEAEVMDFVFADKDTEIDSESIRQCAGHHTFTVTNKGLGLNRETGTQCGFHP